MSRILLALVLTLGLSGCKYTDVMTEHIEDAVLGQLDMDVEPIYKDVPGADPDPTRTSSEISDSDRVDDQTAQLPDYSQNPNNNDTTDQREHEEDTSHDQEATSGDEVSDAEGENAMAGEGESTTDQNSGTGQDNSAGESDDKKKEAGDGPMGGDEATGGGGGDAQVWDATGEFVELPEHVGSIAAVGQYATIVQMLAGNGGLAVADDAWISDVTAKGLFPDEGVSDLTVGWTKQADDTYAIDLDAVIEAKPDAVLMDNTDVVLSEAEQQALISSGINVITAPNLGQTSTTDEAIVSAVNLVGELLKNSTTVTYDTQEMASKYTELRNKVTDIALQGNGGYSFKMVGGTSYQEIYQCTDGTGVGQSTTNLSSNRITTAFIDSWFDGVYGSTTAKRHFLNETLYLDGEAMDSSGGVGLSATTSSRSFVLMDYYLQMAGVVDNAYDGERPASSDSGSAPYVVIAGTSSDLVVDQSLTNARSFPSALWYCPTSMELGSSWLTVGDDSFPAVLVRSDEIAQKVVASASLANGVYNVGQPYEVVVVPSGACGSWADGNVESFLLSVWSFCKFRPADASSQASCDDCVDGYYHLFYRASEGTGTGYVDNYDTVYTAECPNPTNTSSEDSGE